VGGSADGSGFFARFNWPISVAVDSAGTVYVADSWNHTIRKGYPARPPSAFVISAAGFGFDGGQFGFSFTGPGLAGQLVVVEASTDLVSWLPIWTNTTTDVLNFSDRQSDAHSHRFYRAHTP
jgi:DNA-binding beta-propeller fold protein YncE